MLAALKDAVPNHPFLPGVLPRSAARLKFLLGPLLVSQRRGLVLTDPKHWRKYKVSVSERTYKVLSVLPNAMGGGAVWEDAFHIYRCWLDGAMPIKEVRDWETAKKNIGCKLLGMRPCGNFVDFLASCRRSPPPPPPESAWGMSPCGNMLDRPLEEKDSASMKAPVMKRIVMAHGLDEDTEMEVALADLERRSTSEENDEDTDTAVVLSHALARALAVVYVRDFRRAFGRGGVDDALALLNGDVPEGCAPEAREEKVLLTVNEPHHHAIVTDALANGGGVRPETDEV
jgi:hypothetical protein